MNRSSLGADGSAVALDGRRSGGVESWFASRGWEPLPFQREVWTAIGAGRSGLLHSGTGTGKTLAVWLGFLQVSDPGSVGLQAVWL
ncbi:MAG: hypothetical protein SNJ74_11045, partial [Fimbriimonadaceae bacterium]